MLVEVQLMSTSGNGWESLTYELSSFDGSMQETGTLETGFDGVGLHSGVTTSIKLIPAKSDYE